LKSSPIIKDGKSKIPKDFLPYALT
jgi:hypothetical protein